MKYIKPLILIIALAVTGGGVAVGQNPSHLEMADRYGNSRGMMACLLMKQGIYDKDELDAEMKSMGGDTYNQMLLMLSMVDGLIKRAATREVRYQVENCPTELKEYLRRNHQ